MWGILSQWKQPGSLDVLCCVLSEVWLSVTPWAAAHQAPLSMELSRQEYWSGLPFLPPGDLPNPGKDRTHASCVSCIGMWILYHVVYYYYYCFHDSSGLLCSKCIIKHEEWCLLHAEAPKFPRVHQSSLVKNVWACWKGPFWKPCPDVTEVRPEVRFRRFCHRAPTESQLPGAHCNSAFQCHHSSVTVGQPSREESGRPPFPAGEALLPVQVRCAHPSGRRPGFLTGSPEAAQQGALASTGPCCPHTTEALTVKNKEQSLHYLWTKLSRQLSEGKWLLPLSNTIWTKSLCFTNLSSFIFPRFPAFYQCCVSAKILVTDPLSRLPKKILLKKHFPYQVQKGFVCSCRFPYLLLKTCVSKDESSVIFPVSYVYDVGSKSLFLTVPHSTGDLSALTRGGTRAPCSGSTECQTVNPRGVPQTPELGKALADSRW